VLSVEKESIIWKEWNQSYGENKLNSRKAKEKEKKFRVDGGWECGQSEELVMGI
jgi:hypothetical protein